jgi:NHLM bacteriocin system ABC transporter ATP-binding protein
MTDVDIHPDDTVLTDPVLTDEPRPELDVSAVASYQARTALIAADNERALHAAVADIRAGVATPAPAVAADPAGAAVQAFTACARQLGLLVTVPRGLATAADPIQALLESHRVRSRAVRLTGSWQRRITGVLIGQKADGGPVALLPAGSGYRVYDPATGQTAGLSAGPAIRPEALLLYRSLPDDRTGIRALAALALAGCRRDLLVLGVSGVAFGLLSLAVPLAIGTVVPLLAIGGPGQVWWLAVLLAAAIGTASLTLLARNAAVIRLQGRLQDTLEPAIWDRLLRHDVAFFRKFSTGELVQRGNAIAEIRQVMSGVLVNAVLGAAFSITSMILVLLVSWQLGLILLTGVAVLLIVLLALARRQVRRETVIFEAYGEVYGLLYAILLGIDKIQTAGREIQAFARWAGLIRRARVADAATMRIQAASTALTGALQPLLIAMTLAGTTLFRLSVSIDQLTAAGIAVSQLMLAVGQVSQVWSRACAIPPILRRLGPIMAEPQEVPAGARDPGRLSGAVELDRVTFRYPGSTTTTLHEVSVHAEPGEMVAVVGRSGAGKSTLIRMLLGFERPAAGDVRYDGQALAGLNVRAVRRQIGTVLQNARLIRGTLLDNILGPATELTEEDAWYAADLADLGDDLRRLPMGLATKVDETGEGFSGGQLQRLMIARALVRRPALLLLDEATSALDNTTQRAVSDRIAQLACTRVVIAHRLSTVRRADRIYLLDAGQVVAHGGYRELLDQSPLFARLVGGQELQ